MGFIVELGILTGDEIHSRMEVFAEKYAKELQIEASCLGELAAVYVAPATQQQIVRTGAALAAALQAGFKSKRLADELEGLVKGYDALSASLVELRRKQEEVGHDPRAISEKLRSAMAEVRAQADALEQQVADDLWPLPKYREMLFCGV